MEVSCYLIDDVDFIPYLMFFIHKFKILNNYRIRSRVMETIENAKTTVKRPEIYKPFRFLIVIFGLLELSGFAVLANYSIIMVEV